MNTLSRWYTSVRSFATAHKITSALIAIAVLWVGWHFTFGGGAATPTRYVVSTATNGTLVVSVTGTGQVAASEQIDVKPKTSGDVTSVRVAQGQTVKAGTTLATLDATSAQRAVRDAQQALTSAQVSLQQLQANQTSNVPQLQDDVTNAYQDGFNAVANAFLSLPSLATDTHGLLYDNTLGGSCSPNLCQYSNLISASTSHEFAATKTTAVSSEEAATSAYKNNFDDYRATNINASQEETNTLLDQTLQTAQLLLQATRDEQNLLDSLVKDLTDQAAFHGTHVSIPSQITSYQSTVASNTSKLTSMVSSLRNAQRSITSTEQSLSDAQVQNPLSIQSSQNTLVQRENALTDAQQTLADTVVRAPFDGVIAKVNVKKGDSASSGTTVATLVTTSQIATLTLNEVDAAKVAVGQPATLTFDAVPDLTIAGTVATVDTVGTVSQGVVTYTVTIAFATQDDRVKPGMSTSAAIVTQAVTDALVVPSSAVKSQGGQSYVQVFDGTLPAEATTTQGFVPTTAPQNVIVQVGLSNDTQTQITSGLDAGAQIITRTITSSSTTNTTGSAPSLLNAAGVRSGGGNATFRATGGGAATTGR